MQLDDVPHVHLTHCLNVHPGEAFEDLPPVLEAHVLPLKERLAPDRPFGLGLRLAAESAAALADADRRARFRAWLDERGLYVFAINGFPYGAFHGRRVKDDVYRPDWTTRERVTYTRDLVAAAAGLIPEGVDGGISTSPLSYKPWLRADKVEEVHRTSARHIAEIAVAMARVEADTGRELHLDIEPEPHCLLETTGETVAWFERWLLPEGNTIVQAALGVDRAEAERLLLRHVAVCYDACHLAVAFEAPEEALGRLADAGIRVGRLQISAALDVPLHADRAALAERLGPFAESVYLHQVNERLPDGSLRSFADLPDALPHLAAAPGDAWRIHYHVPVFTDDLPGLGTTQADLARTIRLVRDRRTTPHLEIETYTWDVLPPELKLDLHASVAREYDWVTDVLRT